MESSSSHSDSEKETEASELGSQNVSEAQERNTSDKPVVTYELEWRRWVLLFVFVFNSVVNNLVWLTFAPITALADDYYSKSDFEVNLVSLIFLLIGVIFCMPSSWLMDKKGLKPCMFMCAGVTLFGCWLRCITYFIEPSGGFWLVLIGTCILAFAQPTLLLGSPKLACIWFGDKERSIATSVASLSNLLGMAIAYLMGPSIVNEGSDFPALYLWQAGLGTLSSILIFVLFREAPVSPPSSSSHVIEQSFISGLKIIRKQKNFLILNFSFGLGYGIFAGLFTIMDQVVGGEGYTVTDSGIFGMVMIGFGIVAGGVAGAILDKTRAYRPALIICFCGAFISTLIFYSSLYTPDVLPHTRGMVIAGSALAGFFAIAVLPIAMEAGVEVCYPVGEATVSGVMVMTGGFFAALLIGISSALQSDNGSMIHGVQFLLCCAMLATCLICFFHGPYKRLQFERSKGAESELP